VDVAIPPKYWWQLVSNGGIGKVLWRDNLTGLIWSDVVSMAGWCHASGSNNKLNSPLAEADTFSYCNSEANQSQTAPVSLCAELPELVTPPESSSAKGGLAATWWLPGIEDLRTVYAHGAKSVLPEFSSGEWWSSSIYTSDRGTAGRLSGVDGSVINPYRYGVNKVRCVGVQ
jgi:hypothetical protein